MGKGGARPVLEGEGEGSQQVDRYCGKSSSLRYGYDEERPASHLGIRISKLPPAPLHHRLQSRPLTGQHLSECKQRELWCGCGDEHHGSGLHVCETHDDDDDDDDAHLLPPPLLRLEPRQIPLRLRLQGGLVDGPAGLQTDSRGRGWTREWQSIGRLELRSERLRLQRKASLRK